MSLAGAIGTASGNLTSPESWIFLATVRSSSKVVGGFRLSLSKMSLRYTRCWTLQ